MTRLQLLTALVVATAREFVKKSEEKRNSIYELAAPKNRLSLAFYSKIPKPFQILQRMNG